MRNKEEWVFIPQNFNIDALLDEYQIITPKYFRKEKALWILDALLKARCSQRKEMNEKNTPFANLSTKILKNVVSDYSKYINFFLETGVLSTDNQYVVGEKSKGYCFNSPYTGQELKKVIITDKKLILKIKKERERVATEQKMLLKGYEHITKWWETGKHAIDEEAAIKWIDDYLNNKIAVINADIKKTKKKRQKLIHWVNNTRADFKKQVSEFKDKTHVHLSKRAKRLYTPLSNMKRELRNLITYDGKPLVEIDIKNSQPFFCLVLFKKSFWAGDESFFGKISLEEIGKDIKDYIGIHMDIIMCEKLLNNKAEKTFEKFKDIVTQAKFYKYLENEFKVFYPGLIKDIKKAVLTIMYLDNGKSTYNEPSKIFKNIFPEVYSLFESIKSVHYKLLPIILQRIESYIILKVVCKKINEEHPDLYFSTLHDSILTTQGNEEIVESIMKREIKRMVGYEPKISRKPSNACYTVV